MFESLAHDILPHWWVCNGNGSMGILYSDQNIGSIVAMHFCNTGNDKQLDSETRPESFSWLVSDVVNDGLLKSICAFDSI